MYRNIGIDKWMNGQIEKKGKTYIDKIYRDREADRYVDQTERSIDTWIDGERQRGRYTYMSIDRWREIERRIYIYVDRQMERGREAD